MNVSVNGFFEKLQPEEALNTGDQGDQAQPSQLTDSILEDSVDKALKKADNNWDGYVSWDEYVYSLGDSEVAQHVNEYEKHGKH